MGYQNVKTPRFYINTVEWLGSLGVVSIDNIYRTLPVDPQPYMNPGNAPPGYGLLGEQSKWFGAILGHDLGAAAAHTPWYQGPNDAAGSPMHGGYNAEYEDIANATNIAYDGWSLALFGQTEWGQVNIGAGTTEYNIGSIIVGTYYDMPHSPELSLTMTREMDGVKKIRTKGGVDLVDRKYTKPPLWGALAPWEIGDANNPAVNQKLSRVGRRTWDLSFNYLDDGDVFGPNMMVGMLGDWQFNEANSPPLGTLFDVGDIIQNTDPGVTGNFLTNILTDDNFFQVIHKTNGGQLPFIFAPSGASTAIDEYAICKFNMKSLKCKQVANGVYNINIKLTESW